MRKPTIWVPTRSDANRAEQSQEMVRGWKFWIKKDEELYYPCSENKGADQLRSYCEADLRLCFRLCRLLVFACGGSFIFLEDIFFVDYKQSLNVHPYDEYVSERNSVIQSSIMQKL